jgi:hypothetical protein
MPATPSLSAHPVGAGHAGDPQSECPPCGSQPRRRSPVCVATLWEPAMPAIPSLSAHPVGAGHAGDPFQALSKS